MFSSFACDSIKDYICVGKMISNKPFCILLQLDANDALSIFSSLIGIFCSVSLAVYILFE